MQNLQFKYWIDSIVCTVSVLKLISSFRYLGLQQKRKTLLPLGIAKLPMSLQVIFNEIDELFLPKCHIDSIVTTILIGFTHFVNNIVTETVDVQNAEIQTISC